MNERIEQLAEQSGIAFLSSVPPDMLAKFAELIVKECIDTVQKRYMGDNNREDMEVRKCVQDLKQHFGVEE